MTNLRESDEDGTNSEHVGDVKSNTGEPKIVGKVSDLESMTHQANHGVWRVRGVALDFADITTEDGLVLK